jgi:hypothetical protein
LIPLLLIDAGLVSVSYGRLIELEGKGVFSVAGKRIKILSKIK